MIAALLLGRKGSVGTPGKNLRKVLGQPMAWYPLQAALRAKQVDRVFLSTDDEELMALAAANGAEVIVRPPELCTAEALGEDAYGHGFDEISKRLGEKPEMMVLLFCNAATLTSETIDTGIDALRANPDLDSAVTVSKFNMYSPVRARRIGNDGLLQPFLSLNSFDDGFVINCDRNCQGDVWFADCALSVVRPICLEDPHYGVLPQRWMGRKIYPIKQVAGCDLDDEWQFPVVEWWLKKYWQDLDA